MIAELLGIDWPSRDAWFTLTRGLDDLADRGRRTPCQVDPAPFTSEDRAERAEAAAACRACPVLRACAAFALANAEPLGVWGGVDLTPSSSPSGSRKARRAKLERAAAGVLDPDAARVERHGPVVRQCGACGNAFVARAKHARFCSGACRTRANRHPRAGAAPNRPGGGVETGRGEGRKTAAVRNPPPDRGAVTVTAATVTTRHSEGAAR